MRALAVGLALAALAPCGWSQYQSSPQTRDGAYRRFLGSEFNLLIGRRDFTDGDRAPLDKQTLIALDYTYQPSNWWLGLETGLNYSWDRSSVNVMGSNKDLASDVLEFSVGLKKSFMIEAINLRPYVGGGGSFFYSWLEGISGLNRVADQGSALGLYGKLGLVFQLNRSQHIGIEYRAVAAEETSLGPTDVSNNYQQLAFVFGVRF